MKRIVGEFAGSTIAAAGAQAAPAPHDDVQRVQKFSAAIHPIKLRAWMKPIAAEPSAAIAILK